MLQQFFHKLNFSVNFFAQKMAEAADAAATTPAQEKKEAPAAEEQPKRRKRIALKRDREEDVKQAEKSSAPAPKRKKAARRKHGYAEEVTEETKVRVIFKDYNAYNFFLNDHFVLVARLALCNLLCRY